MWQASVGRGIRSCFCIQGTENPRQVTDALTNLIGSSGAVTQNQTGAGHIAEIANREWHYGDSFPRRCLGNRHIVEFLWKQSYKMHAGVSLEDFQQIVEFLTQGINQCVAPLQVKH